MATVAARKTIWIMVRGRRASPMAVTVPSRAAWMFAGNMAIRSRARPVAAHGAVRRHRSPAAPTSSRMPVTVTSSSGSGRPGGTMLTISARMPTKWAAPVPARAGVRLSERGAGQPAPVRPDVRAGGGGGQPGPRSPRGGRRHLPAFGRSGDEMPVGRNIPGRLRSGAHRVAPVGRRPRHGESRIQRTVSTSGHA